MWFWVADIWSFLAISASGRKIQDILKPYYFPKTVFSLGFWMESSREKIIGKGQISNLIKIVQLFELRCLTAYEDALISLPPCNPIQIMFCLKWHYSSLLWWQPRLGAFRLEPQDSQASELSGFVLALCMCLHAFRMILPCVNSSVHSWFMFHSQPLSLCSHLYKMAPKVPEWCLVSSGKALLA